MRGNLGASRLLTCGVLCTADSSQERNGPKAPELLWKAYSLWLSAALLLESTRLSCGSEVVSCSPHPHHLDQARKTLDARINDVFAYD